MATNARNQRTAFMVWLGWMLDRLHGAGTMVTFGDVWWPEKGRP